MAYGLEIDFVTTRNCQNLCGIINDLYTGGKLSYLGWLLCFMITQEFNWAYGS